MGQYEKNMIYRNADHLYLKQQEAGISVKDLAREHGISTQT
jgi:hypothetical protein